MAAKMNEADIFGDLNEKARGRKHFAPSNEDQVAQILEHPLSYYTTTYESCDDQQRPSRRTATTSHREGVERQRCAR